MEWFKAKPVRIVTTEHSRYSFYSDGGELSVVRVPLVEAPRRHWSPLLADLRPIPIVAWGVAVGLWAPEVRCVRYWAAQSRHGVVTSPAVAVDGVPLPPLPAIKEMRLTVGQVMAEVVNAPGSVPVWDEFHGALPEGAR